MKKAIVPNRVVISRTDSIGDVVLTLPLCVSIKKMYPDCHLMFLAAAYTIPVIAQCEAVDEIIDWSSIKAMPTVAKVAAFRSMNADVFINVFPNKEIASLAKKAKVEFRIGTSHRPFHLLSCNVPVSFTRKKSDLHEAQLNFNLALPIGLELPSFEELKELKVLTAPNVNLKFEPKQPAIIIHPKSQGSAVEWSLKAYSELANKLSGRGINVYVTGTENEGKEFRNAFDWSDGIVDVSGLMSLKELIGFIAQVDLLLACSTGPLHLAGALGVPALGLFSPKKPIHPGRWKPLGLKSETITSRKTCPCKTKECNCIDEIGVDRVFDTITKSLAV